VKEDRLSPSSGAIASRPWWAGVSTSITVLMLHVFAGTHKFSHHDEQNEQARTSDKMQDKRRFLSDDLIGIEW